MPPSISPSSRSAPSSRRLRRIAVALALTGVAVAVFDWNWLRGPIGHLVSARLDREFRITGPLDVTLLSRHPGFSAEGLELANIADGKAAHLATVGRLALSIDLGALLRGEWNIETLEIDAPRVHLEEDAAGQGNWNLGGGDDKGKGPLPRLASVRLTDGQLDARLPSRKTEVQLKIATDPASGRLRGSASGRWRGEALAVDGEADSVPGLISGQHAHPLKAKGNIGATHFFVDGTLPTLTAIEGLDAKVGINGRSLAELYPISGVPLPATPPYRFAARLTHTGERWHFEAIDALVGHSDLSGVLDIDRKPQPMRLTGALRSQRLDLSDLSGFLSARDTAGRPVPPRPGKVLPDRPLGFEKIAAADVELDFSVGDIRNTGLPLEAASGHLRINGRQFRLAPLKVGMAKGTVEGQLALDTRNSPANAHVDMQARRLRLRELMPDADSKRLTTGTLGGRMRLDLRGNSVAELLGSANGDVALAMNGGSTDRLLVRLANLDIANAVASWLAGGQKEDIRCLVADMGAKNGVLEPRTLLLDTERVQISGSGNIDMNKETLDLHMRAAAKDRSILALRGPLRVTGTFAAPSVTPEPIPLGTRVAGALALGLIAPPLALLPLIELGGAEDSACARLLQKTDKRITKP